MKRRFFPFDKNYLLQNAQIELKDSLLNQMVEIVKEIYLMRYNPLGLKDKSIEKILSTTNYNLEELSTFYEELAGFYRYKYSSNQLELLFDGRDHQEKYEEDWSNTLKKWVIEFSKSKNFLKAVLETSIFFPDDKQSQLAYSRLKNYMTDHFGIKIYKHKGIVPMKIA
ncbi:hypothetical protein SAMN05661096_01617 [Marivirga sericea]|uniref:Uncharacterized protein n=1 Tax=Marivirga sericea TaxID=1028 RepID=A0A1X7JHJ6_9BACT|nr:hypothetical protein [Marivirga sericea]SMG27520.1 hypothetical protein SAMN05661096_01617 [Marivirga sericea]